MGVDRLIGFVPDATVGGTPRASLTGSPPLADTGTATIADPTIWVPVTNVSVDKGIVRIDRNEEIRRHRGQVAPKTFRRADVVTVSGLAYPYVLKRLVKLATGGTDAITGSAPAAITHKFQPVGYGVYGLGACHIATVRDDLYQKYAGCQLGSLQIDFPLDGEATWQATFLSLYATQPGSGPGTPDYSNVVPDWVYTLRDVDAFLDASVSPVDALRGYQLSFDNGFKDPEFWPKRNREVQTVSGEKHVLWFPQRRKLGSAQQVNGRLMFSDAKPLQDRYMELAHAQKLVMECEAQDLGTTPAAKEMLRITVQKSVYTGGGVSDMTRDDDVTSDYEFGGFLDPTTQNDVTFEFVDASATAITFAP